MINKFNIIIGLLLILITISSCSRSKLTDISINCACEVTEHFITSTNDIDNSTKKYTFINSQLFDLGISKDGFANSFSFQICNLINKNEKFEQIEIDIIEEINGETKSTKIYDYEIDKIQTELPIYLKLESFIGQFVSNIYKKNYSDCLNLTEFKDTKKFNTIIDNIYTRLNKDYLDTKIVDYKSDGNNFSIYGIIKSKSDQLNIFTMKLKRIENEYKIISFNF